MKHLPFKIVVVQNISAPVPDLIRHESLLLRSQQSGVPAITPQKQEEGQGPPFS